MKTGALKLNRKYQEAKTWYQNKKKIIGVITILVCLAIACVFTIYAVNGTFGGFKELYSYPADEYNYLESVLKSTIVDDPYVDLKKIEDDDISYTCDYDSSKEVWNVTLSKDGIKVSVKITMQDGKTNIGKVMHDNKVARAVSATMSWLLLLIFATGCLAFAIYAVFIIVVGLAKFVCLVERIRIKS